MRRASDDALEVLQTQMFKTASNAVARAGYDRTYPARVKRVIDNRASKYEVELLGELYIMFTNNDIEYKANEAVWVTVPQNNFNNKYISGRRK